MMKFMQKFTQLNNSYFCTRFSTGESNNSRMLPLSFLANNLYSDNREAEIRKKLADFHNLTPCCKHWDMIMFYISILFAN